MVPPETAIDIFRHGTPTDWLTHAGGISSVLVAPSVAVVLLALWLRRVPFRLWIWLLPALPAIVSFMEYIAELRRITADKNQVWSRDWNFNELYACAHARLFLGCGMAVICLGIAAASRIRRGAHIGPRQA